jgi:hypothetical protein
MRQVTYTSSLPESTIGLLTEYTRRRGKAKNEVIELALREFFEREKQREFIEGFKKARQHTDVVEMAEEGMDTYLTQLD